MKDVVELVKKLLECDELRDLDITFRINNTDKINDLAQFCGEKCSMFDVYDLVTDKCNKRLVRIRM